MSNLANLTDRARDIFRQIVENYLETGEPLGSKNLSAMGQLGLSPASVRATMAELEQLGLLYSPHVSAGRLPTETGLRLFVDGLLQLGDLSDDERQAIAPQLDEGQNLDHVLRQAVDGLSGLSQCAGLVIAPQAASDVKHIEFVPVSDTQILVILVDQQNNVENRLIDRPPGLLADSLREASNYLNARAKGQPLTAFRRQLQTEANELEGQLGQLTAAVVEAGLADWAGDPALRNSQMMAKSLIVSGQNHLLDDVKAVEDLERIRQLFDDIERKQDLIALLSQAEDGDGVKIFIGSETPLFSLSGSSVIISPYRNSDRQIVGVLGVIAPTRANYARLIPMVDHTAQVVSRLIG